MTTATNPAFPGPEGRRSTRLSLAVPVTLSGKDSDGKEFNENTRTLTVSKHGGKIATVHQLSLGTEVTVGNRFTGQSAKATIAWLGGGSTPQDPREVAVQLHEPQNLWGVRFPPDDWRETGAEALDEAIPPSPPAHAPEKPISRGAAMEAALARFNKSLEEAAERQSRLFEERLSKLAVRIGDRMQADLQEWTKTMLEKVKTSVDQLTQQLQKTADEVRDSSARALDPRAKRTREPSQEQPKTSEE